MRVLVTGGAGFIGSHLVDQLLAGGNEVAIVDNLATGRRENVNPKAEFNLVDITDFAALEDVFRKFKPQVVNHHAAQMSVTRSVADPAYDANINILGSLNLLALAVKHGVHQFVFASTGGAIYGELERFPADEEHPTRPLSPYGVSKRSVELYLGVFQKVHGLKATILRYPNVYGPRQRAHGEAGVVAIFSQLMLKGERPRIFGDGTKTRDYVYVADIVRAGIMAMEKGVSGTFNLGWGVEITDYEVFEAVRSAVGAAVEPVYDQVRPGEVYRVVLDASRAEKFLGWKPEVEFREGVAKAVDFYRDHREW